MSKGLSPGELQAMYRKMQQWRKDKSLRPVVFLEGEALEVLHIHRVNLCDKLIGGTNVKKPIDEVFVIEAIEVILREYR